MAKTVTSSGTGTLAVSGPGTEPTVTITDGSVGATDKIILTPTSKGCFDANGEFVLFVYSRAAGSFVVRSREQLTTAITFNYISVAA